MIFGSDLPIPTVDPSNPPSGVHPLVWLVIFLLVGPPALLSKTAARLPGVLGATARWWRSREPAREPATASYRVSQSEIERIREDYHRIREDYRELVARMDRLEDELTEEKRRSWAAIGYIRRLLDFIHFHQPDAQPPTPPETLNDLL